MSEGGKIKEIIDSGKAPGVFVPKGKSAIRDEGLSQVATDSGITASRIASNRQAMTDIRNHEPTKDVIEDYMSHIKRQRGFS